MAKQSKSVKGVEKLKFHHYIEYGLMRAVLGGAGLFGIDRASAFGGWLARKVGPLTSQHKVAYENMKAALPDYSEEKLKSTLLDMWDNFGRTMFEIPQLYQLLPYRENSRVTVINPNQISW